MPTLRSAAKRMRQARKRHARNRAVRSEVRTAIKKFRSSLEGDDAGTQEELLNQAVRLLDRAASKGVIHANNAARRKSRLMQAHRRATGE